MKIKDRLLLGTAGLGGNAVKLAISVISKSLGWAEIGGPERAAGMLVPPHKVADPRGKVVGYIADGVIAGLLGVTSVYLLSVTGKEKAELKGALSGQAMWTALYGVFATMGATKVSPVSPKTVLTEFIGHTAYGATTNYIASKLGDPGLYNGEIPLSTSPFSISTKQIHQKQDNLSAIKGLKIN